MRGPLALLCWLAITALLLAGTALAQDSQAEVHIQPRATPAPTHKNTLGPGLDTHTKPLVSNVDMVLVPVTVTDPMDRIVTGLAKKNFNVYQDKQKQSIQTLSSDDAPISLGIIFDMSGSMQDKLDNAKEAVVDFLRTANPQDEFFVVGFSDRPELLSRFTNSVSEIRARLAFMQAKGLTALLDAIYLGLHEMRHARYDRKALLIISDGGDNHSRYTESEVRDIVREADVQIFAVGLFDPTPPTEEERMGPQLLSDITKETGGRTYTIDNPNELSDVAMKIGTALRNEYVLSYLPDARPHDGKWHKIEVKLLPPKGLPPLHVDAKKGFYAPQK
jgi:Ca-activated chloride channel family protein